MGRQVKNVKNNDVKNNDLENENQNLKNELEVLKAQMALLIKNANTTSTPDINEDVLVISMCGWTLNLTTEPMGAGNIYSFSKFGEEQMIPRDDLKRIIKVNSKFAKEGLFYIADEEFIKSEKLSTVYSKILDVDSMYNLLSSKKDNFEKIFKSLSETQKDTFIDLVAKKLLNEESIDMNIVSICSKISGRKITEEVEQAKAVLNKE